MKVKTNIRAGAKSGTAPSGGNGGGGSSGRDPNKPPSSPDTVEIEVSPVPTPVVYARCVGI